MAGSLIKIDEEIVTSAIASVTLTGIDSTYDVYMLQIANALPSVNAGLFIRATESGIANSTANYDYAQKSLRTDVAFSNVSNTNQNQWWLSFANVGTSQGENGTVFIFNANNSSEYTFFTTEPSSFTSSSVLYGGQGGAVFTVTSTVDGVYLAFNNSANITSGTFTLYGLKKS